MATKKRRSRNRKSKRRVRYLGGAENDNVYNMNRDPEAAGEFNVNAPHVNVAIPGAANVVRPLSPTGVDQINDIQQLIAVAIHQAEQVPPNDGIQNLIAALQAALNEAQHAAQ